MSLTFKNEKIHLVEGCWYLCDTIEGSIVLQYLDHSFGCDDRGYNYEADYVKFEVVCEMVAKS